jgi:ABC-2 type transport system ATP-binding protein
VSEGIELAVVHGAREAARDAELERAEESLASDVALAVVDLSFRYRSGAPILRGARLQLERGRVAGLLGANGSGKSTLLGAITDTIEGERAGRIEIAPGLRGPIGYATQEIALYPHLTVAENLAHAARLATDRWDVAGLVARAIDEYHLAEIRDRIARDLSGGQQRIAHLACSFVHAPSVRLLDEPTTALDFATRQTLIELVRSWREDGIATLVTAHYPEDVEELCSSITLLVDGRTYELGSLRDYLERQERLGYLEYLASDGEVVRAPLRAPLASLADVVRAAARAGAGAESTLRSVQVKPPGLRDVLRRDPSLRAAVEGDLS